MIDGVNRPLSAPHALETPSLLITSLRPLPQKGANYRVAHVGDPTSSFPLALGGFRHLSPEYLITSNDEDLPTVEDVLERETDEDGGRTNRDQLRGRNESA